MKERCFEPRRQKKSFGLLKIVYFIDLFRLIVARLREVLGFTLLSSRRRGRLIFSTRWNQWRGGLKSGHHQRHTKKKKHNKQKREISTSIVVCQAIFYRPAMRTPLCPLWSHRKSLSRTSIYRTISDALYGHLQSSYFQLFQLAKVPDIRNERSRSSNGNCTIGVFDFQHHN